MTRRQLLIALAVISFGWILTALQLVEVRSKLTMAEHDISALQEISGVKLQSASMRVENRNRTEFAMERP